MSSWYRRAAQALPNPGTTGSWERRLAEGLRNLGTFNGATVGPLTAEGGWLEKLYKALTPRPTYGGANWPKLLANGGPKALYDLVVQSVADAQNPSGGVTPPDDAIAFADFIDRQYWAGGATRTFAQMFSLSDGAEVHVNGLGMDDNGTGHVGFASALLAAVQAQAPNGITVVLELGYTATGEILVHNEGPTGLDLEIAQSDGAVVYNISSWNGGSEGFSTGGADLSPPPMMVLVGFTAGSGRLCASVAGSIPEDAAVPNPNPLAQDVTYFEFPNQGGRVRTMTIYPEQRNDQLMALLGVEITTADTDQIMADSTAYTADRS